jgi:hypothetical protein
MLNRIHLIGLLIILILGLSTIIQYHIVFIPLSMFGLYLGFKQFFIDRKDLKNALHYSRIDLIIWKWLLGSVSIIALTLFSFHIGIDRIFASPASYYVFPVFLASFFAGYYDKFVNSLRSYPEGLKMPGRNSNIIPWEQIDQMRIIDEAIEIDHRGTLIKLKIDRRDMGDLAEIVESWKKK